MTQSSDCIVEQVTAGVDWLTMTLPHENDTHGQWHLAAAHQLHMIEAQGNRLKDRYMLGYQGYSCGNSFVGGREDGLLVQFTGHHADAAFLGLYRSDAHISRIDLQVTVRYSVMPMGIGKGAYRAATTANRRLPTSRRRKLYIIVGSDGGDTFYLGSASSDQRGRLYNKEVQSEEPAYIRTWRYECVFRNDRATMVSSSIYGSSEGVTAAVHDTVVSWWGSRGVDCSDIETGRHVVIPIVRTLPTDTEAKLKWIAKQVRPTVKYLVEMGLHEEVYTALGINTPVDTSDTGKEV